MVCTKTVGCVLHMTLKIPHNISVGWRPTVPPLVYIEGESRVSNLSQFFKTRQELFGTPQLHMRSRDQRRRAKRSVLGPICILLRFCIGTLCLLCGVLINSLLAWHWSGSPFKEGAAAL
jgi:hypothetical protein